jgi:hypothetical protein
VTKTALYQQDISPDVVESAFSVNNNSGGRLCTTCYQSVKADKIPRLCLANGLHLPEIPTELASLTRLEERLVAARHVFQTIWTVMGQHGQFRCKGGIVNVPVCVDTTVSHLPRRFNDTNMLHLRLARRLEYQRNYADGNVRPNIVWEAARKLMDSPLYRELEITLSSDWMENHGQANEGTKKKKKDTD